jgi:type IV pilus assembly protein PilE
MKMKSRGITLIELMVVLVVLSILISIAYPSYVDHVRRTRRADAMTGLTEMANLQERYYTQKFQYATDITNLNHGGVSPDGYYNLSIPSNSLTSYTLTATANAPQDQDIDCTTMTLRSNGVKAPDTCWKR